MSTAQTAIGSAAQRPVRVVDRVALIAAGHEAGSASDGVGIGVMCHRSLFAGEIGSIDHIDAGNDQEQDIRLTD